VETTGRFRCHSTETARCPGHTGRFIFDDQPPPNDFSWVNIDLPLSPFFHAPLRLMFPDGSSCRLDGLDVGGPVLIHASIAGQSVCFDSAGSETESGGFVLIRVLPGSKLPRLGN
jgi:hypothetical protein